MAPVMKGILFDYMHICSLIRYPQDVLTRVHSKRRYMEATMRITKAYLLFDSISINISLRMGIMNAVNCFRHYMSMNMARQLTRERLVKWINGNDK
mgnify:CR=1 FL=1